MAWSSCPQRNANETSMADRLKLADEIRLACQLRPEGELRVRRLVLDETDIMITSQLGGVATRSGEAKDVAVFFSDIVDFTALSERLSPYDVMYLLNRYFAQVGDVIEQKAVSSTNSSAMGSWQSSASTTSQTLHSAP